MVKYLISKKDELGYGTTEKIIARTWYDESANRLKRLGFNQIAVKKDDIIPGRTSYYFEGNIDFIINNIQKRKTVPLDLKKNE